MAKIAINGFGRIGRSFFRAAYGAPDFNIVAVNDLGDEKTLRYLLKYDSIYGRYLKEPKGVKFLAEKDPTKLPWDKLDVDIVVESTGLFTSAEKAQAHITAGAKRVVITAPIKDAEVGSRTSATVLMGMNEDKLDGCVISSNASCTTNAGAPLIALLDETIGVEQALLNTVHT